MMSYKKILKYKLLLFMAVSCLLTSCIGEDYDDCPMYVEFNYDYNMSYTDLFSEQCDKVELLVFDNSGVLIDVISREGSEVQQPGFKIPLNIKSGTYTIMAWVGQKDSYLLSSLQKGVTRKEDVKLNLTKDGSTLLEPLWNGTPKTFTVNQTYGHKEVINLVKNTNTVNVNLHCAEGFDDTYADNIEIKIKAKNGSYLYDNAFGDTNLITYSPYEITKDGKENISFPLSILRLVKGEDVTISIVNKSDGRSLLPTPEMDLIDFLLKTMPAGMSEQEYLDRESVWNIDISLDPYHGYIAIMIKINNWTVWVQDVVAE